MAMMTMMITKKLMTNKIDRKFAAKAGSSLHVICKHPIKWLCCPSINLLSPPAEHLSDDVCTLYNHFIIVSLISCIDVKLTRSNVYARLKPFISRLLWRQHCDPVIELIADCLQTSAEVEEHPSGWRSDGCNLFHASIIPIENSLEFAGNTEMEGTFYKHRNSNDHRFLLDFENQWLVEPFNNNRPLS